MGPTETTTDLPNRPRHNCMRSPRPHRSGAFLCGAALVVSTHARTGSPGGEPGNLARRLCRRPGHHDFRSADRRARSTALRHARGNSIRYRSAHPGCISSNPMRAGVVQHAIMASAGPHAKLLSHRESDWRSATFTGTRHLFQLQWQRCEEAEDIAVLPFWPPEDFEIPGKIIADIEVCHTAVEIVPQLCLTAEFSMLVVDRA